MLPSISKTQIRRVVSLRDKKSRDEANAFVACGPKCVGELAKCFDCRFMATTPEAASQWSQSEALCTPEQIRQMTGVKAPQEVVAIFAKPLAASEEHLCDLALQELCLCLDAVQDPGNVGTIVRLADWFGVRHVFLGRGCADAWNLKTVSATMGSLARTHLHEVDLAEEFASLSAETPVFGTLLDGRDIYAEQLATHGVLLMGNEGNGISQELLPSVTCPLRIPSWPPNAPTAESLNVAMATGIALAEFRRRMCSSYNL